MGAPSAPMIAAPLASIMGMPAAPDWRITSPIAPIQRPLAMMKGMPASRQRRMAVLSLSEITPPRGSMVPSTSEAIKRMSFMSVLRDD